MTREIYARIALGKLLLRGKAVLACALPPSARNERRRVLPGVV